MSLNRPLRVILGRLILGIGVTCVVLGALLITLSRSLVNSEAFGRRTAEAMQDHRVAAFVADRITNLAISQRPNLIRIRPLVLGTCQGIVSSKPFESVVKVTARKAHEAYFSEGGQRLVLSLPDMGNLVQEALQNTSPEVAAKVPPSLGSLALDLGHNKVFEMTVDLWRLGHRVRNLGALLLLLGIGITVSGIAIARDRFHALASTGGSLLVGALILGAILPLGRLVALSLPHDPLLRDAFIGLWRVYLIELGSWALFLGGLGILCSAAANSLLDRVDPYTLLTRVARGIGSPPRTRLARVGRGAALIAAGITGITFPEEMLAGVAVVLGAALSYMGMSEVFRLVLETVDIETRQGHHPIRRAWKGPAVVLVLLAAVAGTWIYLKRPHVEPPPASVTAVNGHPELNDRRLNEVVFAGAHNCMSNASIADWMFPHQQAGVPQQLEDGIRALLIDVHYGFPGADRIKTDLEGEKNTREKLVGALGEEAVVTAERIRNRLVGVDEGKRGLYLCHGFCELGGTEFGKTLEDIRTFLETHPEEVLMMVIEDYVTPAELAAAFTASGLEPYIYKGPSGPPWPVMKDLVLSGERVVIFLETGTPGVDWLRPAFDHIQETPYTFHTPEDFSCRPNRGGTGGSLFQINHWIETTPTPLPSNAEIVNAMDVLMPRALRCKKERGMLPNIIAVDFYRSGDLFAVVDSLNGVR